ncbi:MAG: amidohydrolase family protein [Clostridia bacterium]|nr:amidohydrolase family protein [Clostridia bacterium]
MSAGERHELGITGGKLYINGKFTKANLYADDGLITAITSESRSCIQSHDATGKKVMPGLIDPHVHFSLRSGGHVSCDDFRSGSAAAAFGGITTFIDFLDPVSTAGELDSALLSRKAEAAESAVDYSFHATAANPAGNTEEIANGLKRLGINSLKIFTTYSESGRRTYDREIAELLKLSELHGFVLMVHAEDDDMVGIKPLHTIRDLPKARSQKAESSQALKLAGMVVEFGGGIYMVHTSSGKTVRALLKKHRGLLGNRFHIESCPHYFALDDNVYRKKDGELYAMVPPLRSRGSRKLLKRLARHVETIGTDHCPYMKDEKKKTSLLEIPMGIGTIENSFAVMHGIIGDRALDMMSRRPAEIFGLFPRKGILAVGSDADIVIYDDSANRELDAGRSACDYSVYEGFKTNICIEKVFCRGRIVVDEGSLMEGYGTCLL